MKNLILALTVLLMSNVALSQDETTTAKVSPEKSEVLWTGKKCGTYVNNTGFSENLLSVCYL